MGQGTSGSLLNLAKRLSGSFGVIAFCLGLGSVPAYSALLGGMGDVLLSLLPIGLLALFYTRLLRVENGKRAFLMGFCYGLGLFLGGVSWIYVSLSDFAAIPSPLAALMTLLFSSVLAFFPALAAYVFYRLARAIPASFVTPFVFAGCFTLGELLRGSVLTGFPWLALGYSQADSPLAGYASIVGVYGVGFCAALTAVWLATLRQKHWRTYLVCFILWGGGLALAQIEWTSPEGEPISVTLLQGNVPQSLKWQPGQLAETLSLYRDMILEHPAQLVLLPETAFPTFLDRLPPEYLAELRGALTDVGGDLLLGIPTRAAGSEEVTHYYNSAVSLGISPDQHYAKRHLVPYGEFIPPGFRWFLRLANIPLTDFTAGERGQSPLAIAGTRVAISICYEDLFGEETLDFLPEAALLVNLSNTAWFGRSLAPGQHLQIARMRALETGRPVLRAGNTGVTALITPKGNVAAALPTFTRAALRVETPGYSGSTPYIHLGNWPAILLALAACLLPFVLPRLRLGK
ncbi:MAG: apolipoprotein N-acyltransferase [Zoogloeaceae bacterium]|jgi:apolipoprotein N-acyltransferase|nr:apolipoprotein N-acyltransferase [Zoogloeaceae bacterium]